MSIKKKDIEKFLAYRKVRTGDIAAIRVRMAATGSSRNHLELSELESVLGDKKLAKDFRAWEMNPPKPMPVVIFLTIVRLVSRR